MSDKYYGFNSYEPSSSDYKQSDYKSGYTDFSSSSYNYDKESSFKQYDGYSSFSHQYENKKSQQPHYKQQNLDYSSSGYEYQQGKSWANQHHEKMPLDFSSQLRKEQVQERANEYDAGQKNVVLPKKPLDKFTVRDVLELPLNRQEYLKSLQIKKLRQQPEYNTLFKRPGIVLGIVDYYQRIIPDTEFNAEVKSLKRGKDIKQALWLTSMIGYLMLTGGLQSRQSSYKGIFKGKYHLLIPFGLTVFMVADNRITNKKTAALINDRKNTQNIDIAIKKFLCDTTSKQRVKIFGNT